MVKPPIRWLCLPLNLSYLASFRIREQQAQDILHSVTVIQVGAGSWLVKDFDDRDASKQYNLILLLL